MESSKEDVCLVVDSGEGGAPPKGKPAKVVSRGKKELGEAVWV